MDYAAISERQEDELLNNISNSIKKGGLLFIEARSINDELFGKGDRISETEYIFNDHYRRFLDKSVLADKLKQSGYKIIEELESDEFSKNDKSNPTLIRLIAKKL